MKIELANLTVGEIFDGYVNDAINGVYAYNGKLNIRPKYQREFVYSGKQRDEVIRTITKGFPLNIMYWSKNTDGTFEVLDGQQRTISFCEYINGSFSIDEHFFHNLTVEEQEQIKAYPLYIYICEGSEREKLDWFRVVNIAGEKLTDQELRNAVYTGTWLTDAKRWFSKPQCPAEQISNKYINGSAIRQEYLETALKWLSDDHIEDYMAKHQHDGNASELWQYFQKVISWVEITFPYYRREMKGVGWGYLYNDHKNDSLDAQFLETLIAKMMEDDEVTNKKGIYTYVLTGDERKLNLRQFTSKEKREAYERQNGICPKCGNHFDLSEMEGDHIIAWSKGGKTTPDNLQMLCRYCNGIKTNH